MDKRKMAEKYIVALIAKERMKSEKPKITLFTFPESLASLYQHMENLINADIEELLSHLSYYHKNLSLIRQEEDTVSFVYEYKRIEIAKDVFEAEVKHYLMQIGKEILSKGYNNVYK